MLLTIRFATVAFILFNLPALATPTPDAQPISFRGEELDVLKRLIDGDAGLLKRDFGTIAATLSDLRDAYLVPGAVPRSEDYIEARDEYKLTGARAQCWKQNPWPKPGHRWCGYQWGHIPGIVYIIPWGHIDFQYVPWAGIQWHVPPAHTTTTTSTTAASTTAIIWSTYLTAARPQRTFPPGLSPGAAPA